LASICSRPFLCISAESVLYPLIYVILVAISIAGRIAGRIVLPYIIKSQSKR
jgi:hypothetical protein